MQPRPVWAYCQAPLWPLIALAVPSTAWLWWRNRRHPAGCCARCGYDLTGMASGLCPECGRPTAQKKAEEARASSA